MKINVINQLWYCYFFISLLFMGCSKSACPYNIDKINTQDNKDNNLPTRNINSQIVPEGLPAEDDAAIEKQFIEEISHAYVYNNKKNESWWSPDQLVVYTLRMQAINLGWSLAREAYINGAYGSFLCGVGINIAVFYVTHMVPSLKRKTENERCKNNIQRLIQGIREKHPMRWSQLDPTCSICINEQDTQPIQCGHYFHAACIARWWQEHPRCPICNQ
ncbi:RING finger domain-containing protein [Candidatus Cardinium hertigii]|jgi:hypothetical protein|nr:RING finger domain-containing protein [Candidatus Cardinium hertigii]